MVNQTMEDGGVFHSFLKPYLNRVTPGANRSRKIGRRLARVSVSRVCSDVR